MMLLQSQAFLAALTAIALGQALPGFRPVASPRGDEKRLYAANTTGDEWAVKMDKSGLRVTKVLRPRGTAHWVVARVKVSNAMMDVDPDRAMKTDDGWLYGFDAGEFGGGIFWFSPDWKRHKKLSDLNCKRIVKLNGGFYAITGLNHLSLRTGAVVTLDKAAPEAWRMKAVTDLGAGPDAWLLEKSDTLVLLSQVGLVRFHPTGHLERLSQGVPGMLYPNSMVKRSDGSLVIGMRHYLLVLTPTGSGFQEQWYEPRKP